MKRFILEQSDDEIYTSHSGLELAGVYLNRFSNLPRVLKRKMKNSSNYTSQKSTFFAATLVFFVSVRVTTKLYRLEG